VVKILQGSVVTKTKLGGLTIHNRVANFLQCICAKNYENWLAVDKVIAKIIRLTFFGPPCMFDYRPRRFVTFYISALEILFTYLLTLLPRLSMLL